MAGISDKALKSGYSENKYRYNKGSELQNKEFADGSGLEMYTSTYRSLDPQLGKFWQIDPLLEISENVSPYSFGSNDPMMNIDPFGLKDTSINGEEVQRDRDLQPATVKAHKNSNNSTILLSPLVLRMPTDHPVPRPNINTSFRFIPAEVANAASGYEQPPYMKGTTVARFKSSVSGRYVRVFDSKNPKASAIGRWIMRYSEIKDLSPVEIKDKFSLEFTPDKMLDVNTPSGSDLQVSIAGKNVWGNGGGVQYEILDKLDENWFTGIRDIPVPATNPVPDVELPLEEPIDPLDFPEIPIL